jgi:mono/diheme cytochrome c family protein
MKMFYWTTLVFVFCSSCQYKADKTGGLAQKQGALSDEQLGLVPQEAYDFALIQSEVLAPNCFQCHSVAGGNKAGVNLESYLKVKQFIAPIQSSVSQNFMPPRTPLSAKRKEILFQWIQMGMPEYSKNAPSPQPPPGSSPQPPPSLPPPNLPPPGSNLDYATVAQQVFSPSCVRCHSAGDSPNLSQYASVKKVGAAIKRVVASNKMPPRNPLTEDKKQILFKWIDAGMPEKATNLPTSPNEPVVPPIKPIPPPQPPGCEEDPEKVDDFSDPDRKDKLLVVFCF